ncbi:PAAR motif protein [compost metagenome]
MAYRANIHGRGEGVDGDKTTTGAICIGSLPEMTTAGRSVLRLDDVTTPCPKCGKVGKIAEGDVRFRCHGLPVAVDGMLIICGCPPGSNRLIAPLGEWLGAGELSSARSAQQDTQPAAQQAAPTTQSSRQSIAPEFGQMFAQAFAIADSETGQPLANREFVAVVDGREISGATDAGGLAHIRAPAMGSVISLHVLFKSPARVLTELTENVQ